MTMPLQTRSYMAPLYSQALSAIYNYYDQVRDPSFSLAQDIDIDELMLREPKIYQGYQERTLSVSGPNWRVQPFNNSKDKKDIQLAKLVDDAFRFIPHFAEARKRMAGAIFRGQSCELMTGKREMKRLGGTPQAENWWMFNKFKSIDKRRFTIRAYKTEREDGTPKINTELWMSTLPMFAGPTPKPTTGKDDLPSSLMSYGYRKVAHPEWFVRIIYDDEESRLGYGRGLNDVLYFYHWIKQIILREGLQGLERWAQGIVVGTLDSEAEGVPDEQTTDQLRTAMMTALQNMRSRHVYVQDKKDDIEVVQGGAEGHQIVMGLLEYVDDCMMAVCTGAVLMSSKSAAGEAGSRSRDESGAKTQNKIILSDQMKIDEDISQYAVTMWVQQNWSLIKKYGLGDARLPQVKTIPPKEINPNEAATRYAAIWGANPRIGFRKDDVYEDLGATPPDPEEDEILYGADPAAAQGDSPANDPASMMMEGQAGQAGQQQGQQAAALRARKLMAEAQAAQRNRRVRR